MGDYKNGVGIIVTYQAVDSAVGKTVKMDIYDEAHAKDDAKSVAAMTEMEGPSSTTWAGTTAYSLGAYVKPSSPNNNLYECTTAGTSGSSEPTWGTVPGGTTTDGSVVWTCRPYQGRYYATFTPDAEGEWIALIENTTDSNGKVVKAFNVVGHSVDSIGDAVGVVDTVVDGIQADLDNATDGLSAIKTAVDTKAPANEYDTEMARITANVATEAKQDIIDTVVDGIQTDLSNPTDGLTAIKAAVDAVGSPAMVG